MKRHLFTLFLVCWAVLQAFSQRTVWNKTYADYCSTHAEIAVREMHRYHIPASITLAQGVLESGAGRSELARRANNHFGIKCHGWAGHRTYYDDDERGECFRAYKSVEESYEDHSQFLAGSQRYRRLFDLKISDYKGWARGLKACGYATSPTYASQLINIIELYHLYDYDRAKGRKLGARRPVYAFNRNFYVIAHHGDTFRSVADDVDVPYRKLAQYNELDKNATLEEGSYVWLQKKRSKAPKEYKGRYHVIAGGESMYDISQRYGIRLKSLYKLNRLSPDYEIQVGDRLRLR